MCEHKSFSSRPKRIVIFYDVCILAICIECGPLLYCRLHSTGPTPSTDYAVGRFYCVEGTETDDSFAHNPAHTPPRTHTTHAAQRPECLPNNEYSGLLLCMMYYIVHVRNLNFTRKLCKRQTLFDMHIIDSYRIQLC